MYWVYGCGCLRGMFSFCVARRVSRGWWSFLLVLYVALQSKGVVFFRVGVAAFGGVVGAALGILLVMTTRDVGGPDVQTGRVFFFL